MIKIFELIQQNKLLILLLFFFLFYSLSLNNFLDSSGDNAKYIILAKALVEGKGYSDLNLPGNPPDTHFHPLLPVLLTPIIFFIGINFFAMKFLVTLMAIPTLYLIYYFFRKNNSENLSLALMVLVGVSPLFFSFSHQVMAEIPFLFFSFLSLIYFEKFLEKKSKIFFVLSLVFVLLAFFMRMVGLTLFIALILFTFFKRRKINGKIIPLLFFIGLLLVSSWFLYGFMLSKEHTPIYFKIVTVVDQRNADLGTMTTGSFFGRIIHHTVFYTSTISSNLFYGYNVVFTHQNPLRHLFSPLICLIVLLGFVLSFLKRKTFAGTYFLVYFIPLLLSGALGERYLLPVLPFIFYYFFTGFRLILNKFNYSFNLKQKAYHLIFFLLIFLSLIGSVQLLLQEINPNYIEEVQGKEWSNYMKAAEWAKQNTPENAVFVARKENNFFLFSERKTIRYFFGSSSDIMIQGFEQNKADYIVVDEFSIETKKFLIPTIESNPSRFNLIKEIEGTKIYGFH